MVVEEQATSTELEIEADAGVNEVIAAIRACAGPAALQLPATSQIGRDRFALRMIANEAERTGQEVVIVSTSNVTRDYAADVYLRAFLSLDAYRKDPGAGTRTTPTMKLELPQPKPVRVWKRALPVAALLTIGALVGLSPVPNERVTLVARAQPIHYETIFSISTESPDVQVRTISADEKSSHFYSATGVHQLPAVRATATVTFQSTCTLDVKVFSGQRITAGQTGFLLEHDVVVPQNGKLDAPVIAEKPGAAGNVPAKAISGIDNNQATGCLTASNSHAASGGADASQQPYILSKDIDQARSQMELGLRQQLLDDLNGKLSTPEQMTDAINWQFNFTSDHQAGDPVAGFNATVAASANTAVFVGADMERLLRDQIRRQVPAGMVLTDDPIQTRLDVLEASPDGHFQVRGIADAYAAPKIDTRRLRADLAGQSPAHAEAVLDQLPVSAARAESWPVQMPVITPYRFRIQITYTVEPGGHGH